MGMSPPKSPVLLWPYVRADVVCAGGGCCTPWHSKATAHPQGVLTVVENAAWSWGGCTPDLQGPFLGREGLWQAGQGWIQPPPLLGKGQVSLRLN